MINKNTHLWCIYSFMVIVSLVFMLLALHLTHVNNVISIKKDNSFIFLSEESLPLNYFVNTTYDSLLHSESTSWQNSIVDFLEFSFKKEFIKKNYLKQDQFVGFSPDGIVSQLKEFCEDKFPSIASSFISIIEKCPKMKSMPFPLSKCKTRNCSEAIKNNNHFFFDIVSSKYALTTFDIKSLLYQAGKPILLSIPQPITELWIPCDDSFVSDSFSCRNNQPCPSFVNASSCGHSLFNSELPSAEYYQPKYPASAVTGNPLTFTVYGYSDDHVTLIGKNNLPIVKRSVGGFVVKKAGGNTIGFYDGSVSFQENAALCTRPNDPWSWRGPLFKCMQKKHNITKCPSVKKDLRKSKKSATILKCVDERYCNISNFYSLVQSPLNNLENIVYSSSNGMTTTLMYEWEPNKSATLIDYVGLPFQNLGIAFQKTLNIGSLELYDEEKFDEDDYDNSIHEEKENEFKKNSLCNFWFLPYDVVDEAIMLSSVPTNRVHAISTELKWEKIEKSKIKDFIYNVHQRLKTQHL
ncbi:hypothetical protein TRFO_19421 [Tritrichomonas foetus]|uniref:Uncharacterized protein n=1 Tax=Tritrichomonas foetus TaxID=1144522 RepID=A0A1J4KI16_9EUKA|nr:hypothetical protein TRFO_19421 [Tritrichomonas foetus]|eukprot:OHT11031.1 hypothetical protein TRFO_19421 [Tritrichomonas foetus]